MQVRRKNRSNTSGYLGVTWNKVVGLWSAQTSLNGRNRNLGNYRSKLYAAAVINSAWAIHKPEFAPPNPTAPLSTEGMSDIPTPDDAPPQAPTPTATLWVTVGPAGFTATAKQVIGSYPVTIEDAIALAEETIRSLAS